MSSRGEKSCNHSMKLGYMYTTLAMGVDFHSVIMVDGFVLQSCLHLHPHKSNQCRSSLEALLAKGTIVVCPQCHRPTTIIFIHIHSLLKQTGPDDHVHDKSLRSCQPLSPPSCSTNDHGTNIMHQACKCESLWWLLCYLTCACPKYLVV